MGYMNRKKILVTGGCGFLSYATDVCEAFNAFYKARKRNYIKNVTLS